MGLGRLPAANARPAGSQLQHLVHRPRRRSSMLCVAAATDAQEFTNSLLLLPCCYADRLDSCSGCGALPDVGLAVATAILAAAAFMFMDRRRRRAACPPPAQGAQPVDTAGQAEQELPQKQPAAPAAGLNLLPSHPSSSKSGAVVEVAARAISLQPPASAPKAVNLQLSRSMPAAVSPFAAGVSAAQQLQASPLAAPPAPPQPSQAQQSPFAAAAAQPKQLSPFAGAAPLHAAPAAAAASPFASAAVLFSKPPSNASAAAQQQQPSSSAAEELARRPSPPHLSAMLDALPIFAPSPGAGSAAQSTAAGPAASPPPAAQPGRQVAPPAPAPDRISLEQLRSEILGDDPLGGAEAQLESLLSTGLPAVGTAAASSSGAGQQPAGGSPSAPLPPAPSVGLDSDWEIAPNGVCWAGYRLSTCQARPRETVLVARQANDLDGPTNRCLCPAHRAGNLQAARRLFVAAGGGRLWPRVQGATIWVHTCSRGGYPHRLVLVHV